jgi:hypothetical protein
MEKEFTERSKSAKCSIYSIKKGRLNDETAHFIVLTFYFFSGNSTNLAKFSAQN